MKPAYQDLHTRNKPALRRMLHDLGVIPLSDLRIFQMEYGELLVRVLEELQRRGELTPTEVRDVYLAVASVGGQVLRIGTGAHQDFRVFLPDSERAGARVEILPSQIGAIRQEEPGFLKGLMYICGALFHVECIRVKWKETSVVEADDLTTGTKKGDRIATFNEDGDGEQLPWDDDLDSLCSQWWYQSMVHVDECVFNTIEIPPFEGKYVLLIHPGER